MGVGQMAQEMPFLLDIKGCVGFRNKMHEKTMFDKCANFLHKLKISA